MEFLERRALLLTAVGGSLLTLADATNAAADPSPKVTPVAPKTLNPSPIANPTTQSPVKEVQAWKLVRKMVADTNVWQSKFDLSFEEGVQDDLNTVQSEEKGRFRHNPRLVETLLGEISSLLDRCIAYRREGSELEIAGVAAGANRVASDALREIDRKIASIDLTGNAARILGKNYPQAAALFEVATDQNLGKGTAVEARAQALANDQVGNDSEERQKLILSRLAYTQELERKLLGRHDVPGNAHNFGERFERVRKLFENDATSAYRRALAASAGLANIFEYMEPLPKISDNGFVDELILWTRNAMRAVTRISESELEFTRSITVTVPPAPAAPVAVVFDAPFAGFKYVRIRSVGMAFCTADGEVKNNVDGNASIGAVMVKTDTKLGPSVVVVHPNVRQFSGSRDPQFIDGPLLYNVDPRGTWSIRLSEKGISGIGMDWPRADKIKQLVIQFRVIAVPDNSVESAWWVSGDKV